MDTYSLIEKAIIFINKSHRIHPSLEDMAAHVNMSPFHFNRVFKEWAGITPTQFCRFLTLEHAKERLQKTQNILHASYDLQLSSTSRLHDLFVTYQAITPAQYKSAGKNVVVTYGFHSTPFGTCLIGLTDLGICYLAFIDGSYDHALQIMKYQVPCATLIEDTIVTQKIIDKIFDNNQQGPIHLVVQGTNFQIKVWQALLTIPAGNLISYQQLAQLAGSARAARAVGSAVGANNISYLIPCHRVIMQSGLFHNYRWGTVRKQIMIGIEGKFAL